MLQYTVTGDFNNTDRFLKKLSRQQYLDVLTSLAKEGVTALENATPVDSGLAANSWGYEIQRSRGSAVITWTNSDIENGFPVAIRIQLGYGTGTGGYVRGRDYINPALQPVFDRIADELWKAVISA